MGSPKKRRQTEEDRKDVGAKKPKTQERTDVGNKKPKMPERKNVGGKKPKTPTHKDKGDKKPKTPQERPMMTSMNRRINRKRLKLKRTKMKGKHQKQLSVKMPTTTMNRQVKSGKRWIKAQNPATQLTNCRVMIKSVRKRRLYLY